MRNIEEILFIALVLMLANISRATDGPTGFRGLTRSDKVRYWISYRLTGGKQKFEKMKWEEAGSIDYARDADSKRRLQKRENTIFDIKPETNMTFKELADWYLGLENTKNLAFYYQIRTI